MALVGFLDILGTKDAVLSDRFDDSIVLDFVRPVCDAARHSPSVRFAVFSDSVIMTAETNNGGQFLKAIAYIYGQWFADFILVRGGIAEGEIQWVDDDEIDRSFCNASNLTYARVYGKALVMAHELEQKSGPGAICFLNQNTAEVLRNIEQNSVIEGVTPMLAWANEKEAKILDGYMETGLNKESKDNARHRLFSATKFYWEQVIKQKKFIPENFSLLQ